MKIDHILFIRSLGDGHSGGFHLLAVVNNVAMNIYVRVSYGHVCAILLDINLGVELLAHVITQCVTSQTFQVGCVFVLCIVGYLAEPQPLPGCTPSPHTHQL